MCIYIHKKIGRGVFEAAHSHREGRSPRRRWSWKVKDENNQFSGCYYFLRFSLSENRSLHWRDRQPRRETGWGHTALIEPWEGKTERAGEERPFRLVTWAGHGAASAARLCGGNGALFESHVGTVARLTKDAAAGATRAKLRSGKIQSGQHINQQLCTIARATGSRMNQGSDRWMCKPSRQFE